VEKTLRDGFLKIYHAQDRPASQVIREFMRDYIARKADKMRRVRKTMASTTDYHAKLFAHELNRRHSVADDEKLAGALLDAQVDLNPHQVEAALFAFKRPRRLVVLKRPLSSQNRAAPKIISLNFCTKTVMRASWYCSMARMRRSIKSDLCTMAGQA